MWYHFPGLLPCTYFNYWRRKCICIWHSGQYWGRQGTRLEAFLFQGPLRKPRSPREPSALLTKGEMAVPAPPAGRRGGCSSCPPLPRVLFLFLLLWKTTRAPLSLPFISNIYDLFVTAAWGHGKGRRRELNICGFPVYVGRHPLRHLSSSKKMKNWKKRNEKKPVFTRYPHCVHYLHFLI